MPGSEHQVASSSGENILSNYRGFSMANLPPEMLQLIFRKVENPRDLLSCWNTSSAWAAALRSREFYFKMTLPLLFPYLSKMDLLQCSFVSKSWNQSIDACIDDAENIMGDSWLKGGQRIVIRLSPFSKNMHNFIKRFTWSSNNESGVKVAANPVAFRLVEVTILFRYDRYEDNNNILFFYRKNVMKCLNHFGHLIRNLRISIHESRGRSSDVSYLGKMKLVRSCLKRTPNLRVFQVRSTVIQVERETYLENDLETFRAFISLHPWPALKQLKVLKFAKSTNGEVFSSIANAYAPQLQQLQFDFHLKEPLSPMPLTERFYCLQEIVYLFRDSVCAMEFGAFVRSSQCQIKHLTIVFPLVYNCTCGDSHLTNMDGLVWSANALGATLETLVFRPMIRILENIQPYAIANLQQLRLPELKVLELGPFGDPSVQFLQRVCPALEQLKLGPFRHGDERREHTVMYCDLYSKHQFWNQLAHIQSVILPELYVTVVDILLDDDMDISMEERHGEIQRKVYTRTGYEAKV